MVLFFPKRFLILPALLVLAGCGSTQQPPLPPEMTGDAPLSSEQIARIYTDSVMKAGDYDQSGGITESEWVGTGGDIATFRRFDLNNNGTVTANELLSISSAGPFQTSLRRMTDVNRDGYITHRELRRDAAYRLMRVGL